MSFESRYKNLNEQQRQAVDTTEGPLMVVAGPGSGKTELLGMRVANILKKHDVYPSNILCLTFTDSAAKNMRERLVSLIGPDAYKVSIHTFHSFAIDIIHQFHEEFYEGQAMKSADDIIQIEVLGEILEALPLSDALSKKMMDGSYVYLSSVKDKIGKLKRAGLSPSEYEQIFAKNQLVYNSVENLVIPVFENRLSKKVFPEIEKVIVGLESINNEAEVLKIAGLEIHSYHQMVQRTLLRAYEDAVQEDSTKPISAWKKEWLKKDPDTKELHLKDYFQVDRNVTLSKVYEQYQLKMRERGYIDFQDMILDVLSILQTKPGVLESIQEQYQFILVDEFQDTNDAQMRMITLLTDHPMFEGRPNIMVVGDDDQAIYKFQGAEINNILQFKKRYPLTQVITMTKNYRSTDFIVGFAQQVIVQGDDRLVNRIPEIEKELEAANPNIPEGTIVTHSFDSALHEYNYIVQEIQRLTSQGKSFSEIGVIARNHRQLEELAQHFNHAQIPIHYEKQRDILKDPLIQQILGVVRLVISLSDNSIRFDQSLIIEVLMYPFWGLERQSVWELAIQVRSVKENRNWMDTMLKSDNVAIQNIAKWLLDLSHKVSVEPYQNVLDEIIGAPAVEEHSSFGSPFRSYFFTDTLYKQNPGAYLSMLSSLNKFFHVIKSQVDNDKMETLHIVQTTIELYEKHNLSITDSSPYISGSDAIKLLTAHKSKGLEFDTVFVVSCQKNIWLKLQGRSMISFPKNIPLESSAENWDDYLRLFFVAMTRAKSHLYLTSFKKLKSGKDALRVPFLDAVSPEKLNGELKHGHIELSIENIISQLESEVFKAEISFDQTEKNLLQPLVDNYVMSVTHLNNFLDVSRGGPQQFFERNLLMFPQARAASMSYGTAMHATVESLYVILKRVKSVPSLEEVLLIFENHLKKESLSMVEYGKYLKQGQEVLEVYISSDRFDKDHLIETNFSYQNVFIDEFQIRGNIDKMILNKEEKTVEVYDLKTGKYKTSWKASDENKKVQLHGYKRQLIFYKLLVEGSRDFSQYKVLSGALEFLYPTAKGEILNLEYHIQSDDVDRLKKLIVAVSRCIKNLEFPSIEKYPQTYDGIIEFEDDLINGIIK